MLSDKTTLERAFELAASRRCQSLSDVRLFLRREGYEAEQLVGPALIKQLTMLLEARHA